MGSDYFETMSILTQQANGDDRLQVQIDELRKRIDDLEHRVGITQPEGKER